MAKRILTHLDFGKISEIRNGVIHLLGSAPATPAEGQIYHNTATHRINLYTGAGEGWQALVTANTRLDQISAPTSSVSLNSQKITSLLDPTNPQDAATKIYVDTAVQGLDAKPSVVAATTASIAIASRTSTTLSIGGTTLTIDGQAMANTDRLLVKDSTTGTGAGTWDNGIYVVSGIGTSVVLTRVADADIWAELPGAYVFVEKGTANGDNGYVCTVDAGGTLGITAIAFVQFSGAGQITAGAGLTKTGNTLDAVAAAGSGLVVNADNIDVDPVSGLPVNRGGTGGITTAAAKTNLGFMTRHAATIGNGVLTSITVNHALNTRDVVVSVHDAATYDEVECDVVKTDANNVTLTFSSAPATNALRAVVVG